MLSIEDASSSTEEHLGDRTTEVAHSTGSVIIYHEEIGENTNSRPYSPCTDDVVPLDQSGSHASRADHAEGRQCLVDSQRLLKQWPALAGFLSLGAMH